MKAYPHSESGNPVLEANDGRKTTGSYHGFAILEEDGKTYIAFSEYFAGTLPLEWCFRPLEIVVH